MTSNLRKAFDAARARGEAAFVAYLMAGDPDPAGALAYARAALDAGADVLEVGVPFSDPVADGPVIQRAGVRALAGGATPGDALGLCAHLSRETDKPLVLMTYYNPVHRVGPAAFAKAAYASGADGVIVPDLPLEESGPMREACDAAGLDLVLLASPASSPARLSRIAEATRGFLYVVSSYGVTGAKADLAASATDVVTRAKAAAGDVPVAVGFGVSAPEHVATLRKAGADGVIVGSHLVKVVEEGQGPAAMRAEVERLRGGVRG